MNDFNQLAALCHGKHIYIQTHNFPDPDAIASAFGLQRLLAQHEIPSTLCYDGRIVQDAGGVPDPDVPL